MTALTLDCIIEVQLSNLKGDIIMTDVQKTARKILAEKWADYEDARECSEKDLAKEYLHDFLLLADMYEALFNEEVYGTDKGVIYDPIERAC